MARCPALPTHSVSQFPRFFLPRPPDPTLENSERTRNLETNYFTEMCSGSGAGSYLRLTDLVYHSTLARLGTAAHFCEVAVLNLRTVDTISSAKAPRERSASERRPMRPMSSSHTGTPAASVSAEVAASISSFTTCQDRPLRAVHLSRHKWPRD